MTFKVDYMNNGYKISIGSGRTFYASNLEDVAAALRHYYGGSQHENKDTCPLCRRD